CAIRRVGDGKSLVAFGFRPCTIHIGIGTKKRGIIQVHGSVASGFGKKIREPLHSGCICTDRPQSAPPVKAAS
ncbi:MAG TPA: hypothetical protein DE310_08345, partial [Alphaproteobacteria bacterium]|nr:hypothetical protein [Alphaproteobacteria bacterium]